jgi:hypothetical protein
MTRISQPGKTAFLSASVQRQLNTYTLAAGAAGVGILTMSQTTQAKIVYTPTHHVIGKNGQYKLDLNHDKIHPQGREVEERWRKPQKMPMSRGI